MNKVIEIGRNTKDIELKTTPNGKSVVTFSIAVKRTFKNADGEYDSDFLTCVAFGNTAETLSKYVKKGDLIGIEGRLQTRNYTDKEGNNRYATEIVVDYIEFLQPKKQETQTDEFTEVTDPFGDLPF